MSDRITVYELDTGKRKHYFRSTAEKDRFIKANEDNIPANSSIHLTSMTKAELKEKIR